MYQVVSSEGICSRRLMHNMLTQSWFLGKVDAETETCFVGSYQRVIQAQTSVSKSALLRISLGSDAILITQWPFPSDPCARRRCHLLILIFCDLRSRLPAVLSESCDYRKNKEDVQIENGDFSGLGI